MSNQQQRSNKPVNANKPPKFSLSWVYAIIFMVLAFLWMNDGTKETSMKRNISYSEFKEYVSKGYAEKITANDNNKIELTIIPDSAARILGQSAVQEGSICSSLPSGGKSIK